MGFILPLLDEFFFFPSFLNISDHFVSTNDVKMKTMWWRLHSQQTWK